MQALFIIIISRIFLGSMDSKSAFRGDQSVFMTIYKQSCYNYVTIYQNISETKATIKLGSIILLIIEFQLGFH